MARFYMDYIKNNPFNKKANYIIIILQQQQQQQQQQYYDYSSSFQ